MDIAALSTELHMANAVNAFQVKALDGCLEQAEKVAVALIEGACQPVATDPSRGTLIDVFA